MSGQALIYLYGVVIVSLQSMVNLVVVEVPNNNIKRIDCSSILGHGS